MTENTATAPAEAEIISHAEKSFWSPHDHPRSNPSVIHFRLFNVGKRMAHKLDAEFEDDYGLFYDQDDTRVINALHQLYPEVVWADYVYWKRIEDGVIEIIDTSTDRIVARVEVRRYTGRTIRGKKGAELGPNVTTISEARMVKNMRLMRELTSPSEEVEVW